MTGFHCDPETACMSMELTKRLWEQPTDKGVLAYHIIQSFSPGEATPDQVHEIGCEFARRFLADRFECTVSTHLDKGHLHNHIVVNSVSYADGKMLRGNEIPLPMISPSIDTVPIVGSTRPQITRIYALYGTPAAFPFLPAPAPFLTLTSLWEARG